MNGPCGFRYKWQAFALAPTHGARFFGLDSCHFVTRSLPTASTLNSDNSTMRVDFTVLVAAATFLACNEKLLGVNGSPLTNDDNLDPADDNHDAVPSKRSLKFSDNYNERSMMPTEGVVYFFAKRALRYFDPLTGGSFDLRGSRAAAKLECKVLAILSRDELSLKETHFIVMHWYHLRHKPSKKWRSSLD